MKLCREIAYEEEEKNTIKKISQKKSRSTDVVQINVDSHPNLLIKSNNDSKVENYCVKLVCIDIQCRKCQTCIHLKCPCLTTEIQMNSYFHAKFQYGAQRTRNARS